MAVQCFFLPLEEEFSWKMQWLVWVALQKGACHGGQTWDAGSQ